MSIISIIKKLSGKYDDKVYQIEKKISEKDFYKHGFEELSRQLVDLVVENEKLKNELLKD